MTQLKEESIDVQVNVWKLLFTGRYESDVEEQAQMILPIANLEQSSLTLHPDLVDTLAEDVMSILIKVNTPEDWLILYRVQVLVPWRTKRQFLEDAKIVHVPANETTPVAKWVVRESL